MDSLFEAVVHIVAVAIYISIHLYLHPSTRRVDISIMITELM